MVPEENIFKELLKKFHLIAISTRVFNAIKFCEKKFKVDFPSNIPAKFGQNWPRGFGGEDV